MSEFVCGRNTVLEALQHYSEGTRRVFISTAADETGRIAEIKQQSEAGGIPLEKTSSARLNELTGTENHQGVVAAIASLLLSDMTELLAVLASKNHRRLIVLEHVQDPVNLGKIIRTALFLGVDGLVKTKHNSAPLSPIAIKTSSGAAFRLPLIEVTNLQQTFSLLEDNNFWTVGTAPRADQPLESVPRNRDLVYVFGNEGKGLRRLTTQLCDYLVSIPSSGDFESLNVAMAAGIVTYALRPPAERDQ